MLNNMQCMGMNMSTTREYESSIFYCSLHCSLPRRSLHMAFMPMYQMVCMAMPRTGRVGIHVPAYGIACA
jgi:hypothetical protein